MTLASIPQDTPFHRATVDDMTDEQLHSFVSKLQERRLKAWNIYQQGIEAKQRAKDEQLAALMQKKLDQFKKQHDTVVKAIEKLDKYALDIQAIRLVLGDRITNDDPQS